MSTKIEWTDETCNVTVGCSKCSPGCDNCYAERLAARWAKHPNPKIRAKYEGTVDADGKWTGEISLLDLSPLNRLPRKPKRVFIGSMTDMFHENMPFYWLDCIFREIAKWPQHTFIFLTKRPRIAFKYFPRPGRWLTRTVLATSKSDRLDWPLPNVWLGVTVCNQAEAEAKIPVLLQTPAAKRFVSVEPMLGPVDLTAIRYTEDDAEWRVNALTAEAWCENSDSPSAYCNSADGVEKLDWAICGGETGAFARPMHPDWVRGLRDQCQASGTPFFFKGWGEWVTENQSPEDIVLPGNSIIPHGWKGKKYEDSLYKVGKRRAGRLLDGIEYSEFPEA